MKLKISNIGRIILLGGGTLLRKIVLWALSEGVLISIVTSPRHAIEKCNDGISLEKFLMQNKVPFIVEDKIQSSKVNEFIGDSRDAFCLSLGAAWIFNKDIINNLFRSILILSNSIILF